MCPDRRQSTQQSLDHLAAKATWSDQALLDAVTRQVTPVMTRKQPIVARIVDDTGIPKKGRHSVGVARQSCGQQGKQDNCQVAVSLSVATWQASLPVAWRLYLPREGAEDRARRRKAGVPEEVRFQTKPEIAIDQIREALDRGLPCAVVLADAGYGADTRFREQLAELGLQYVVGVQGSVSLWRPGEGPVPPKPRGKTGRPPELLRRSKEHSPVSARELVLELAREGAEESLVAGGIAKRLASRNVAVRLRPGHRDYWRAEPHEELCLLAEWPQKRRPTARQPERLYGRVSRYRLPACAVRLLPG